MIGVIAFICALGVGYDMFFSAKSLSKQKSFEIKNELLDTSEWLAMPDVTFTAMDGKSYKIADFKGKVVVLNFWATWCPACNQEFASILKMISSYKGNVVLLAVSVDDGEAEITKFLEGYQTQFGDLLASPTIVKVWDKNRDITTGTFHTLKLPEAIIISKDGKMVKKVIGEYNWEGPEIFDVLNTLLSM